jgi:hypothetical protein
MEEATMCRCPTCGEQFSTPQQLRIHRVEQHRHEDESPLSQLEPAVWSDPNESREVF